MYTVPCCAPRSLHPADSVPAAEILRKPDRWLAVSNPHHACRKPGVQSLQLLPLHGQHRARRRRLGIKQPARGPQGKQTAGTRGRPTVNPGKNLAARCPGINNGLVAKLLCLCRPDRSHRRQGTSYKIDACTPARGLPAGDFKSGTCWWRDARLRVEQGSRATALFDFQEEPSQISRSSEDITTVVEKPMRHTLHTHHRHWQTFARQPAAKCATSKQIDVIRNSRRRSQEPKRVSLI